MEQKEGFFRSIGRDKLYIVINLFYAYFAQGIVVVMFGAILPVLKADYSLSYQVGGMLLSVQSVGYAIAGLGAGFLPLYLGLKNSFILLTSGITIGMGMLLVSGNPVWLLIAMAFIGVNKGAVTNYNNQIMSDFARGNAGPLNILVMAAGQLGFLYMLLHSHTLVTMMIATVGLGLSMSGMYGTSVSNAGDLFARYPVCMGFFVLLTSMGAVIAPAAVGLLAGLTNMRTGLAVLLLAAAALVIMAAYNAMTILHQAHDTQRAKNQA